MADSLNPSIEDLLETDDAVIEQRWADVQAWLEPKFGKTPGIESILFLIGVQSRGHGFQPKLKRHIKQDLIMEGTHCVFETLGLYKRVGNDAKGHTVWEQTTRPNARLSLPQQEKLLRLAILNYFDAIRSSPDALHQPN